MNYWPLSPWHKPYVVKSQELTVFPWVLFKETGIGERVKGPFLARERWREEVPYSIRLTPRIVLDPPSTVLCSLFIIRLQCGPEKPPKPPLKDGVRHKHIHQILLPRGVL